MEWKELQKYHFNSLLALEKPLLRTANIQKSYDKYLKKHPNINKIIYNKYFMNNDLFIITCNYFPYNLSNNIKHLILWFNPIIYKNKIHILLNQNYIKLILNRLLNKKKYICFINLPKNQSIKNISHYHVFIKY